jgi:NAD(P)-dependent dehydrogenase (short-subunit alcohol dehydrogenase family)
LITTPFGFQSTAEQVIAGVNLSDKRAIVTGASSGIGVETARVLASAGANVTLAVRNPEAGARVAADITASANNDGIRVAELNLTDLGSVDKFVAEWEGPLHILINNAGVMMSPQLHTPHGWELQFATNHLGHFALTTGLQDALADAHGARIVAVSSTGHLFSPVVFDDIHFRFRPYDPLLAYGQSKTANILFTVEATRRWKDERIYANALNPGAIQTNLQRHVGGKLATSPELQKTVAQGAATTVLLAASPLLQDVGGHYFNDCNEVSAVDHRPPELSQLSTCLAPYAIDKENSDHLWEASGELIANARP